MKKILAINPDNITQKAIMNGFTDAFEKLGFFVQQIDIKSVNKDYLNKFKPNILFAFDYSCFQSNELIAFFKEKTSAKKILYFINTPNNIELNKTIETCAYSTFGCDKKYEEFINTIVFLPLAVNPTAYKKDFEKYDHWISYVGNPSSDKKLDIIIELVKLYGKISLFCNRDDYMLALNKILENNLLNTNEIEAFKNSYQGALKNENEVSKVFNSSRINLNIMEPNEDFLNYKIFEVLASCGFLITEYSDDINKYFDIGRELETFDNKQNLIDKIEFYIQNLNIAQSISRAGRKHIVNSHSFLNRCKKLLQK